MIPMATGWYYVSGGSKLTAARRMKQKFPFPKEKGDTTKSDQQEVQWAAAR